MVLDSERLGHQPALSVELARVIDAVLAAPPPPNPRKTGGRRPHGRPPIDPQKVLAVHALADAGVSAADIAARVGIHKRTVYNILKRRASSS